MRLENLLNNIEYEIIKGNLDTYIKDICYDSRKVSDESLFVCLVGASSDGHDYIDMLL